MRILIDFRQALVEFAQVLGVHEYDIDSLWYVSGIFDSLVLAALDSNKGYTQVVSGLVSKLENETGEHRSYCQSACDLAITQILEKMDEIFANLRHIDLFKTNKDIRRAFNDSMSVYAIDIRELTPSYV